MDLDHAFKRRDWSPASVARVQRLCMALPEVVEAEQFGGPWWKAGKKPFACYGAASQKRADGYHGVDGVTLKLPRLQATLLGGPRFEREMMMGHHGWTHMRFTEKPGEWDDVADLVVEAYRGVANQRMLRALDATASRPPSGPAPRSASSRPPRRR
jgi:hypothetical protein